MAIYGRHPRAEETFNNKIIELFRTTIAPRGIFLK